MVKVVEFHNTACLLCRGAINGNGVLAGYDPICLSCAGEIASALKAIEAEKTEEEEQKTALSCPTCGEQFTNKGRFLAHCKACGKKHKNGLKVEAPA